MPLSPGSQLPRQPGHSIEIRPLYRTHTQFAEEQIGDYWGTLLAKIPRQRPDFFRAMIR
jgi:hypothetical protein